MTHAAPKPSSRLARGYLICLIGTAFLASTAIFIRYLSQTYRIPALILAFWRDLFLAAALALTFALFAPRLLRFERAHLKFMLLYGLEVSLFNALWTISVAVNGAAVATVLAYSSTAFTAVLGWRLLGERLGLAKSLAVLLSLAGCVFISGAYDLAAWQLNPLGILAGILTGLAYAGYTLLGRVASKRRINSWTTLLYAFSFACLFLLAYNLLPLPLPQGVASPNLFWLGGALAGWAVLAFLGIGPTIGGFGLYNLSLTYLPASVVNLVATLEPVMTAIPAFFLLGERFSPPQWLGSALIIGGVLLLRLSEREG